jgi:hypothetical protein
MNTNIFHITQKPLVSQPHYLETISDLVNEIAVFLKINP